MDLFTSLDVFIGLVVIYLILGLTCTIINEWIDTILQTRAQQLREAICEMLGSGSDNTHTAAEADQLCLSFYQHPNIVGLARKKDRPTYISPTTFRETLLTIVKGSKPLSKATSLQELETSINSIQNEFIRLRLESLLDDVKRNENEAEQQLHTFQTRIEDWFKEAMERTSDWYKRRVQLWTFISGAVISVALNVDTIAIARFLFTNPEARQAFVQAADKIVRQTSPDSLKAKLLPPGTAPTDSVRVKQELARMDTLLANTRAQLTQGTGIPVGWDAVSLRDQLVSQRPWVFWLQKLAGLLLTVAAVSAGAPFWFDLLKKVINIRNALKEITSETKNPNQAR